MQQGQTDRGNDRSKDLLQAIMNSSIYSMAPLKRREIIELKYFIIGIQYTQGAWYKLKAWVIEKNYIQRLQPFNLLQDTYFEIYHEAQQQKEIFCEQFLMESSLLKKWEQLKQELTEKYKGDQLIKYDGSIEIQQLRSEKLLNLKSLQLKDEWIQSLKEGMKILDKDEQFQQAYSCHSKDSKLPAVSNQQLILNIDFLSISVMSCYFVGNKNQILEQLKNSGEYFYMFFLITFNGKYSSIMNFNQLKRLIEQFLDDKWKITLSHLQFSVEENQNLWFQNENKNIVKQVHKYQIRDLNCTFIEYLDPLLFKIHYYFIGQAQNGQRIKESTDICQIEKIIKDLNNLDSARLIDNVDSIITTKILLFNSHQTYQEKQSQLKKGSILVVQFNSQTFGGLYLDEQFILQIYSINGKPAFNNVNLEEFLDQSNKVIEIEFLILLNTIEELTEKATRCLQKLNDEVEFNEVINQHPTFKILGTKIYQKIIQSQNQMQDLTVSKILSEQIKDN